MRILAIDPGPNMGYALAEFSERFKTLKLLDSSIIRDKDKSYTFLAEQALNLDVFVVENYIISPKVYGHSHEGDSGETLRMIGAIEMLCHLQDDLELVLQLPSTKPAGYGFLGKSYKRGKRDMHGFDAMAHLMFYLVTKHQMPPLSTP